MCQLYHLASFVISSSRFIRINRQLYRLASVIISFNLSLYPPLMFILLSLYPPLTFHQNQSPALSSRQRISSKVGIEGRVVLVPLQVLAIDEGLDPLLEVIHVDVELELPKSHPHCLGGELPISRPF